MFLTTVNNILLGLNFSLSVLYMSVQYIICIHYIIACSNSSFIFTTNYMAMPQFIYSISCQRIFVVSAYFVIITVWVSWNRCARVFLLYIPSHLGYRVYECTTLYDNAKLLLKHSTDFYFYQESIRVNAQVCPHLVS